MKTDSRQLFRQLIADITINEPYAEKEAIAQWVMEHQFGLSRADVMSGKIIEVQRGSLDEIVFRLNQHEPVQYILGEAEFYGRKFIVNPNVLIPRPETEMMVRLLAERFEGQKSISVLDIGTGSGCIAITTSFELPSSVVSATDISAEALDVAQTNAAHLKASVDFIQHDILKDELRMNLLDAVVSNPPYILEQESTMMSENVVRFEPHNALFVPNSDPLVFHKAIGLKARKVLKGGGILITEINEKLGREAFQAMENLGYRDILIVNDLHGKNRFLSAVWP